VRIRFFRVIRVLRLFFIPASPAYEEWP